jgi:hypothetical protein
MLQLTVSRPVCLGMKHQSGAYDQILLLSDICGFVDVGRCPWREDEYVVYNCCWPSPPQSFSDPSPLLLGTVFYCLTRLRVLCYDRRSVDRCVLEWNTNLGLTTRFLLLSDTCGFVDVGRCPWREDRSVAYNYCWPLPAQSFSDPSPVGLATVFYCLRFETSLFVASYDSQGFCGGIRPRLRTGITCLQNALRVITSRERNRDQCV